MSTPDYNPTEQELAEDAEAAEKLALAIKDAMADYTRSKYVRQFAISGMALSKVLSELVTQEAVMRGHRPQASIYQHMKNRMVQTLYDVQIRVLIAFGDWLQEQNQSEPRVIAMRDEFAFDVAILKGRRLG